MRAVLDYDSLLAHAGLRALSESNTARNLSVNL